MVRYSIIPKLTNTGDIDFEGWFRQFLAHASRSKYDELVNSEPHPDLPSDGEATVYASMRKEQRKVLRKHTKALNDLYTAFHNNNTGYAIIEKSKMDRRATTEEKRKQSESGQEDELLNCNRDSNTSSLRQQHSPLTNPFHDHPSCTWGTRPMLLPIHMGRKH
mmetsp:Transcript_14028/g.32712  ORF Transcript_14028/g.32712 Transcript_14028/m.32712 type:complete len:163 (+) Transcript_14028:703-1191(+)